MPNTEIDEAKLQRLCEEYVQRNVYCCQTALVEQFLKTFSFDNIKNLDHLCVENENGEEHCFIQDQMDQELVRVGDAISQAEEAVRFLEAQDKDVSHAHTDLENLKEYNLRLHTTDWETREVLEWWVVSRAMEAALTKLGHVFLVNEFGTWWGRTISGQAISIDCDIRKIVMELEGAKLE